MPANATPGDHTAGIAVGLTAFVTGSSAKNLTFEQRVVAKVALRISGAVVAKLAMQHLHASYSGTLNPFGTGTVTLTYTLSNVGNVNLGANQKVTISGLFGPSHSSVEATVPDLLPGSSTTVTVHAHDVWPAFLLEGVGQSDASRASRRGLSDVERGQRRPPASGRSRGRGSS